MAVAENRKETTTSSGNEKLTVFISYSRADMGAADRLVDALEARGFKCLIDRRDLEYGEKWQGVLRDFIRAADAIVFVVSPRAIGSHWCRWEVAEVAKLSKRLIPIVIKDVVPEDLPPEIGAVHLMPFDPQTTGEVWDRQLNLLVQTLLTDRTWVQQHTHLSALALKWDAGGRRRDGLLRGAELASAEDWKRRPTKNGLVPDPLVEAYISDGRADSIRTQRRSTRIASSVAIGALILSGLASWQGWLATKNAGLAERNAIAATKQQVLAEKNAAEATRQRDEAERQKKLALQREQQAAAAAKAERKAREAEAAQRRLAEKNEARAILQERLAKMNAVRAEQEARRAFNTLIKGVDQLTKFSDDVINEIAKRSIPKQPSRRLLKSLEDSYWGFAKNSDLPALRRSQIGTVFQRIASTYYKMGDKKNSLRSFNRFTRFNRQLIADDPENPYWKSTLAAALLRLGNERRAVGDRAGQIREFKEAVSLYEALVKDPAVEAFRRDGFSHGTKLKRLSRRNLAIATRMLRNAIAKSQ